MKKELVLIFVVLLVSLAVISFVYAYHNGDSNGDSTKNTTEENKTENKTQEKTEVKVIKNKTREVKNITFVPWQKRNESECPDDCSCHGAVVSCETETGKIMTIEAGRSGNIITITIERDEVEAEKCEVECEEECEEKEEEIEECKLKCEEKDDEEIDECKLECEEEAEECELECEEECEEIEVDTELELETENETEGNRTQNKTKLKAKLSNGRKAEIKIMPDTASEKAIERLGQLNFTIQLKEVGKGNNTQLAYELQAERHFRILALFKAKALVKAEINAENGEIIIIKKPWWAFLAKED